MSSSHFAPPRSDGNEEMVTNWRLILITASAALLFVAALVMAGYLLPPGKPSDAAPSTMAPPKNLAVSKKASSSPALPGPKATPLPPASRTAEELAQSSAPVQRKPEIKAAHVSKRPDKSGSRLPAAVAAKPKVEPTPAALPLSQQPAEPRSLTIKHRQVRDESSLLTELSRVAREVDLDRVAGSAAKLLTAPKAAAGKAAKTSTVLELLPGRDDLRGLPVRQVAAVELDKTAADRFEVFSLCLRRILAELEEQKKTIGSYGVAIYLEQAFWNDQEAFRPRRSGTRENPSLTIAPKEWQEGVAVSILVQTLQAQETPSRRSLVRVLSRLKSPAASVALAQRAIFDLSEEVREEAVLALAGRPRSQYQQVLLAGLRYPWPPVADHAAEALAALQDTGAFSQLVSLLDQPNPAAPRAGEKDQWVVPELVRTNHLRNCLLCHAPSFAAEDRVRAPVPKQGEKLPPPERYYSTITGPAVRADRTYLKQDFSVLQAVEDHGAWPELQRFDYLIRLRPATAEEVRRARRLTAAKEPTTYPQREAVLFALRELSGKDAGTSAVAWRKLRQ
jgi:hypothetical protein